MNGLQNAVEFGRSLRIEQQLDLRGHLVRIQRLHTYVYMYVSML